MRDSRNSEVLAEIPARSRDGRDEDHEKSRQGWEEFFAAIDAAQNPAAIHQQDDEVQEEAA